MDKTDETMDTSSLQGQAGEQSQDEDFTVVIHPSKSRKRRCTTPLSPLVSIETSNKFAALASSEKEEVNKVVNAPMDHPIEAKRVRQPPIVIDGKIVDKSLYAMIQIITKDFVLQHNNSQDRVNITTFNKDIKTAVINELRRRNIEYHTFSGRDERRNTYVIKGLQGGWSSQEVREALAARGVDVFNVNLMKNVLSPIYVISTNKNISLSMLKEKVGVLLYTKVNIEKYANKRQISQCHRCQEWGHVAANCFLRQACLKCAGAHFTHECIKPRDTPARCTNCKGDHPANSVTCPVYLKRLELLEKRRAQTRQATDTTRRLQPAPPPTINAWEQRARQAGQTQQTITSSSRPTDDYTNKMNILSDLFKEMNSLIDLDLHIREMRRLNDDLRNCKTEYEKNVALKAFAERLNNAQH